MVTFRCRSTHVLQHRMDDGFGCNINAHHNTVAWALLFCMPEFVAINAINVFPLLSYKSIASLQYQVTLFQGRQCGSSIQVDTSNACPSHY